MRIYQILQLAQNDDKVEQWGIQEFRKFHLLVEVRKVRKLSSRKFKDYEKISRLVA